MAARSLALGFVLFTFCIASVRGADPDPLVDNPANVTNFVLRDSFRTGDVTNTSGGIRVGLNTRIFPALQAQGITVVQFKLEPCGINPPHTHPRATELLTVISGGPIQAGLVDTSGKAFIYVLYPGDIIVFPRGLLHYELNLGNETAFFLSSLNSQNPGTLTAAGVLLKLPSRAVASALNSDLDTVDQLKNQIYPYSSALEVGTMAGCVPSRDITIDF